MNRILFHFDSVFSPPCKQGAEVIIPAVLGGLGVLGTAASTITQSDINYENQDFARKENEKNRRYNSQEAEKGRSWQSFELDRARNYESDQWQNRFNQEIAQQYAFSQFQTQQAMDIWRQQQEYNSPANQAQRMLEAGFNPAAVGGVSTYGSGGLSPAPSTPVSPSVSSPTPSGASTAQSGSSLGATMQNPLRLESFGSFIADISKATKDNATLKPVLDGLIQDVRSKELHNEYQGIANNIKRLNAPKEVEKAFEEVAALKIKIGLLKQQTDESAAKTLLLEQQKLESKSQEILNYFTSDKVGAEGQLALMDVMTYWDKLDNFFATQAAQRAASYGAAAAGYGAAESYKSQAGLSREQMETEIRLRGPKVFAQNLSNSLKSREISIADFKLSQSELDDARRRQLIERRDNSWILKNADGFAWWIADNIGKAFGN